MIAFSSAAEFAGCRHDAAWRRHAYFACFAADIFADMPQRAIRVAPRRAARLPPPRTRDAADAADAAMLLFCRRCFPRAADAALMLIFAPPPRFVSDALPFIRHYYAGERCRVWRPMMGGAGSVQMLREQARADCPLLPAADAFAAADAAATPATFAMRMPPP